MLESIENDNAVNLAATEHPFTTKIKRAEVLHGLTVSEMLPFVDIEPDANLLVFVNDRLVRSDMFDTTIPQPGDTVAIKQIPMDDGGGKDILRTVAMIAVMVAATHLGGLAAGVMGKFGGALVTVGVGIAGSLAVNALIPPPMAEVEGSFGGISTDRSYTITGTRNQALPFGAVPRVVGSARLYPPRAAAPYTSIEGNSQFLHEIYCLGPGPLDKSQLKIGETLASTYDNFEYEYLTGTSVSTLYPTSVTENPLSILLDKPVMDGTAFGNHSGVNWSTQTTAPDTTDIECDFYTPGLVYIRKDGTKRCTVWLIWQIEVSPTGTGTWQHIGIYNAVGVGINVSGPNLNGFMAGIHSDTGNPIRGSVKWSMPSAGQWDVRVKRGIISFTGPTDGWQWQGDSRTYHDLYWSALRSKGTGPAGDPTPVVDPIDQSIEFVAIRVKATDQLNGTIDSFNLMCQAHHPVFDGSSWSIQATSNPAWVYSGILTDSANKRALAYSRLNGANLLSWANDNDAIGFSCNGVLTSRVPVKEVLRQVAAVGRASPGMPDELHGVVRDVSHSSPVQHFTPRNSWGYKGQKTFVDVPHAIRCKFVGTNGQPDEVIVYDDGYDENTATKYESLDFALVNNADQAWKLGRYHLAVMRLRPDVHQITVDWEHLICTRGDLVSFSHDAPSIGLVPARIKNISINASLVTLTLDTYVTMESGKNYGVTVRTDTSSVSWQVDTVIGSSYTVTGTLAPASSALLAIGDLLSFGELGNETAPMIVKEIIPGPDFSATIYLVDESPGVLTADSGVIPPWNPHITLPPEPKKYPPPTPIIEGIVSDESVMVVDPNGQLISSLVVEFRSPSVIGENQPVAAQAQYRFAEPANDISTWAASAGYSQNDQVKPFTDNGYWYECQIPGTSAATEPTWPDLPGNTVVDGTVTWICIGQTVTDRKWRDADQVHYDSGIVTVSPVIDGAEYELRIRHISNQGVPSDWEEVTHIVVGGTTPPADPTGLNSDPFMNGMVFTWDAAPEIDFKNWEYRIQVESEGWGGWTETTNPEVFFLLNATQSETYKPVATVYIEVRAYDRAGNVSGTVSTNANTGTLTIPSTALTDFEQISGAFYEVPVLRNINFTSNSPSAGSVAWTAGTIFYNGNAWSITAGNSSLQTIYWVPTNTVLSATDGDPPEGSFIIAVNNSGTYSRVWGNAVANGVFGSAWIKNLHGSKIDVGSLTASQINGAGFGTLTLTSGKIEINTSDGLEIGGTGNIKVNAGRDINLIGSSTDPGRINFQGSSYTVEMGLTSTGDVFMINPTTENTQLNLGNGFILGSSNRFEGINLFSHETIQIDIEEAIGGPAIMAFRSRVLSPSYDARVQLYAGSVGIWFAPHSAGYHKAINLGRSTQAWDEAYADNWHNVADFYHMDWRTLPDGTRIEVDDLAAIRAVKPSSKVDPITGFTLINDSTIPQFLLTRHKSDTALLAPEDFEPDGRQHWVSPGDRIATWKKGEIALGPDGKPYLSNRVMFSLLMGAIRALDDRLKPLEVLNV